MNETILERASFFALVHLLERHYKPGARVGQLGPAEEEIVRFRTDPSLTFPNRDIQEVRKIDPQPGRRTRIPSTYEITANFLGLLGTVSPLPAFYSEQVLQHDEAESARRGLFDLFHHRLLSLFYRAGLKYRYQFGFQDDCSDHTSRRLLALAGFGPVSPESFKIRPAFLLRYAGLLFHRPRSASILQTALADFLGGLQVAITQCIPRWIPLQASQLLSLGRANGGLGRSAMIGARMRACTSAFRITLGPMSYSRFARLLPRGGDYERVIQFARLFITDPFDFDLELKVYEEEIPSVDASSKPVSSMNSRLGWTTWLIKKHGKVGPERRYRTLVLPARARRRAA